ncbi:NUDIX domain-containing protein [Agriterribacter sp.]|uniref:NUDIX hydrolase n=1 Tax=Agriterribacter sp. TaxID=2821509 RepID=UPI002C1F200D|nr:NUDIX domain-containing protein [Agriterribacter sp.]HRP55160.1 NUDIX domain-containing protein [Agriterribacter sp.]
MEKSTIISSNHIQGEPAPEPEFTVGVSVDCVIFGFEDYKLKVLLIKSDMLPYEDHWSLLGDIVNPDEDIDAAVSRIVKDRTGLNDVYMEQVRTFGKVNRHPKGRVITTAYCSLLNIRHNELKILDNELHWHDVQEIKEMAFDHMEILDACRNWLQYRVQKHPLGLRLLETEFSLRDLQLLYETILGEKMDRRNFRKKFFSMELLIDTGIMEKNVPHRPGKLYRFDYEKYGKTKKKKWQGIDF